MSNERGFSLVEILCSIVILGLVATVFFQFFLFSQKTTTSSQEKLVAINIAQGVLERMNHRGYLEITEPEDPESIAYPKTYSTSTCNVTECPKYTFRINNVDYKIVIEVGEKPDSKLRIRSVVVKVLDADNKPQSSVKGFVEI